MIEVIKELCVQYLSSSKADIINPTTDLSSKAQSFIQLLLQAYQNTPEGHKFCGIVFVKRRIVANLLREVLIRIPNVASVIFSSSLVGHGRKNKDVVDTNEGMNFKEQCEVIGKFRYSFSIKLLFEVNINY